MCTITVIPVSDGLRLGCNRDESLTRSPAIPPSFFRSGECGSIYPRDPDGGGTWVAVNDSGLAFAILNVNLSVVAAASGGIKHTRGEIIPILLACRSLDDAVLRAIDIRPIDYLPFRLVVTDGRELFEVVSSGEFLTPSRRPIRTSPGCFTSSGLGDELVVGPRTELFHQAFADRAHWRPDRQDEFHQHSWADRRHLSVCMRRPDARTVSYTIVELFPNDVRLTYHAGPPDEPAPRTTLALQRKRSLSMINQQGGSHHE